MRPTLRGAGLGAILTAALASPALAWVPVAAPVAPGCAPGSAVAHYSGGAPVTPAPGGRPVPCGVSTGFAGAESHIVATARSVVFMPAVQPSGLAGTGTAPVPIDDRTQSNADPAGLAVTSDQGATWTLVKPFGLTWNPTDHGDYVDPATGRLFFEDYGPIPLAPALGPNQEGPAHVMWTNDPTSSAGWHHTALPAMFLPENPRFEAAPPPPGATAPSGYPDVVYFCANTNVGFVSPVITGRVCYRSLDGGDSFTPGAVLFTGAAPQHPECGGSGEIYSAIDGYYPQAAPDGTLYVMVACGGSTYLARSTDEAATFPILHNAAGRPVVLPLPPTAPGQVGSPDLRVDPTGTMYIAWEAGPKLLLIASGDRGRTWSAPLDVTAPGVSAGEWAMAQRNGAVAVAYLGHTSGQVIQDAYLTETTNPAAVLHGGRPLFFSAKLNQRPIYYGSSIQGSGYVTLPLGARVPFPPPFGNQMLGNDFIGATIAPDGSAWASFDQDCGPTPDATGCQSQSDQTRGFAGRLVWTASSGPLLPAPAPPTGSGASGGVTRPLPATGSNRAVTAWGVVAAVVGLALAAVRRRRRVVAARAVSGPVPGVRSGG